MLSCTSLLHFTTGVYGLYFDKKGRIIDYKALLTGTSRYVFHFLRCILCMMHPLYIVSIFVCMFTKPNYTIGIVEEDFRLGIPG